MNEHVFDHKPKTQYRKAQSAMRKADKITKLHFISVLRIHIGVRVVP